MGKKNSLKACYQDYKGYFYAIDKISKLVVVLLNQQLIFQFQKTTEFSRAQPWLRVKHLEALLVPRPALVLPDPLIWPRPAIGVLLKFPRWFKCVVITARGRILCTQETQPHSRGKCTSRFIAPHPHSRDQAGKKRQDSMPNGGVHF